MAKKELPKAQLGAIIKMAKGAYQGMKTGYKTYKAASLAEKAAKLKKAQAAARAQKAAATRAANAKAANAAKNSTTGSKTGTKKPGTKKPGTTKPETPKGKDPFVKSKARVATENVIGKVIGGAPFYTVNAVKKVLKSPIARGIIGGGTSLYVANRYAKTNAPKKVKKYKKK